ncbi:hypothetical protein RLIN73S_00965 [Rhodanobacter lindaniclasticus]
MVSHVTGVNIANRVSLSDMWFRDSDRELEGKDQYYAYMDSLLGPLAGAAKNVFIGSKMIGDGHTLRGIETMLPSFAKNAMKGYRFASQGVNTLAGAPIVSDVSGAEAFAQLIGLQPTSVAEQYRINSAAKNYGDFISDRRTSLRNAYAMAVEQGDNATRSKVQDKIVAFNRRWPLAAIKPGDIRASLRGARQCAHRRGWYQPAQEAARHADADGEPDRAVTGGDLPRRSTHLHVGNIQHAMDIRDGLFRQRLARVARQRLIAQAEAAARQLFGHQGQPGGLPRHVTGLHLEQRQLLLGFLRHRQLAVPLQLHHLRHGAEAVQQRQQVARQQSLAGRRSCR